MSINSPLSMGNFDNDLMLLPENKFYKQKTSWYAIYTHVFGSRSKVLHIRYHPDRFGKVDWRNTAVKNELLAKQIK